MFFAKSLLETHQPAEDFFLLPPILIPQTFHLYSRQRIPQSLSISRKISRKTAGGRGRWGLLWCLFETLSFYHLIPQILEILAEQSKSFRNGFGLFF